MGAWISQDAVHGSYSDGDSDSVGDSDSDSDSDEELYAAKREAELISLQEACGRTKFEYCPRHRHSRDRQICIAAAQLLHTGGSACKRMGGAWLGRRQRPFDVMITQEYARYINFAGITLDNALMRYLRPIDFPQRNPDAHVVLSAFADAYFHDNCVKGTTIAIPFANSDAVFVFSLHVLALLTDFTNEEAAPVITLEKWLDINRGHNDGQDFAEQFLVDTYRRLAALQRFPSGVPDCA